MRTTTLPRHWKKSRIVSSDEEKDIFFFSLFIHRVEARRWFVVEEDGFFSENLYVGEESFAGRYFWRGREGKDDNGEWGKWTNFNWIGNLIVKWGKYIFLMGIWFDESQKFFSVSFGLVEILGNEFKNWEDFSWKFLVEKKNCIAWDIFVRTSESNNLNWRWYVVEKKKERKENV